MSTLIDALPGLDVSVSRLLETLSTTWSTQSAKEQSRVSYASQMTLVLFTGASPEHGPELLKPLTTFSQKYPCRILWVCLDPDERDPWAVRTKVQAYSYLRSSMGAACCEIIMLHCCAQIDRRFLTGLLSTWLHSDLPVYFWAHRLRPEDLSCLPCELRSLRCVVFDSSIEPELEALLLKTLPNKEMLKDLAYARSLPARQALGQFLSAYDPLAIIENLNAVTIEYQKQASGEARHLLKWVRHCMTACAKLKGRSLEGVTFASLPNPSNAASNIKLTFEYKADKFFQWSSNEAHCLAALGAKLEDTTRGYPMHLRPVPPA